MIAGLQVECMPDAFGMLLSGIIIVGVDSAVKLSVEVDIRFAAVAVPVSFE